MRPEIVAADRKFEVRRAATVWRKAGEIDTAAEEAIAKLYSDDRLRTTKVFRVLFFFFTWFGFSSAYGLGTAFVMTALGSWENATGIAAFHFLTGLAVLVLAEILHTQRRMRRFGVEEAAVWIGIGYTVGGGLWLFDRIADPSTGWMIGLGAWGVAATATLAAWRWGTPWTGFLAAGGLFVALTQAPFSHLAWLAVAFLTAWPLAHLSMAAHVSPQGRRRFREGFLVATMAGYFAIHIEVVEASLFARLHAGGWRNAAPIEGPPAWIVVASGGAMVLMSVGWLAAGLSRRYRPAIDTGAILLLVTYWSFAFRLRPEPKWLFLLGTGLVFLAFALYLKRLFAARAGAEWRGLTSRALADDRASSGSLETLASLAAFAPAARDPQLRGFEGEGGEFGGGGASAKF